MELCYCTKISTTNFPSPHSNSNSNSSNSHSSLKPHQISQTLGHRRRNDGRVSSLLPGRAFSESGVELGISANLLSIARNSRGETHICCGASGDRVRAWREAVGMGGAVVGFKVIERRRVLGLRVEAGGGGDTMWVTATAAVALVLSLAAFAAIGGFLLSKGLDNQIREEEEEIQELKAKGLYSEPTVTQYEEQGVGTSKRNRRVSEE